MNATLAIFAATALWGASVFQPAGKAGLLFFISTDCPISNGYAPEIQRICTQYSHKGVSCSLIYEDVALTRPALDKHRDDYGYRSIPVLIDEDRAVAKRAGATVTPEVVLLDAKGSIRYRGRINNFYAALGKPRQQVTQHDLVDALEAVLARQTVTNPETKALGCYIIDPKLLRN